MNKQRRADLLLVLITAFWGMSYFLTDLCMTGMTPMSLNAFRFIDAWSPCYHGLILREPLCGFKHDG